MIKKNLVLNNAKPVKIISIKFTIQVIYAKSVNINKTAKIVNALLVRKIISVLEGFVNHVR